MRFRLKSSIGDFISEKKKLMFLNLNFQMVFPHSSGSCNKYIIEIKPKSIWR